MEGEEGPDPCAPLWMDLPMSGLSILIHGVKSLPNATLCEKSFYELHLSTFLASDKFCPLLMIFSNSLDPDQGQ